MSINKKLEFYLNNRIPNSCIQLPKNHEGCLKIENYLSEFVTKEQKELALENLGIKDFLEKENIILPQVTPESILLDSFKGLGLLENNVLVYKKEDGSIVYLNNYNTNFVFFDFFAKDYNSRVEDIQSLQLVLDQVWNNNNIAEDWREGGMGLQFYNSHKNMIPLIKFYSSNKKEIIGFPLSYSEHLGYYNYSWALTLPDKSNVILNLYDGVFSIQNLEKNNYITTQDIQNLN